MEKKLQKRYLTYHILLIVQYLWQTHYQILLIIYLKDFIKLNVNQDMMIKYAETCRIKYKYCNCFFGCKHFKDDSIEYKVVTKVINESLTKS